MWTIVKILAGAIGASLLWWLKLQKARLEIAELKRIEKRHAVCDTILRAVRQTRTGLERSATNVVFSEEQLAVACNQSPADVASALAMLEGQHRAKRTSGGSWEIWT